ncbi:hypothetical protein GALMADRAFT_138739 [Galerina marginata CBS 339.88]|uniref:DUF6534 domain-containing protein n=1 Tax=Galerina marginata (strain CBS 339.88) TaxID=685588 RepID=A0A067T3A2_GALM3|nr:hypothetical protein GALMADRAFT_138739 [Galerina marginata CBS 339.88]
MLLPLTPNELGKMCTISPFMKNITNTTIASSAGPLLIAHLLNWGLFGVLSMQVYLYYLAFPKDRIGIKIPVYAAYLLDATQTFLLTRSAFRTFALGFGNPSVLNEVDILWFGDVLTGLISFISQTFYAYRIGVLFHKPYLAAVIMLLAVVSLTASIVSGVQAHLAGLFSELLRKDTLIVAGIWGGGSALCDVLIAVSMTYYLKRHEAGFQRTDALLERIIRLTVGTGSTTAAIAILGFLLFFPVHTTYYQTVVSVQGKMYSNSMMVSLNSRMKIGPSNSPSVSTADEFSGVFRRTAVQHDTPVELKHYSEHLGGVLVTREEISSQACDQGRSFEDLKVASSRP